MSERPHVVIVGGGFGGLAAARHLARAPVRITLVDARNHHLFQPLLYQVATAGLSPGDITEPIRGVLRRQRNVEVLLDTAVEVDRAGRRLICRRETLAYDWLVVAAGARKSYFGRDEWAEHAPGLKTIEDALEVRRRVLLAYEEAEWASDPATRAACLTFVVVGGGPTGVELAGALAELARHTLVRDFRRIDPRTSRVLLFEGGPRVLATMPEALGEEARRALQRLGVEVRLGQHVTEIGPAGLTVRDVASGRLEEVRARTVLWTAGVAAVPLAATLGVPLDRAGRVTVEPDLRVPGDERVYVVGDLAVVTLPDGSALPGIAPAAMQAGAHAARNIRLQLAGKPTRPFRYVDKGVMATVGRAAAVARVGKRLHLSGMVAWVAWLVVHVLYLIGFRDRLVVLVSWAWAYFTYERGARLITEPVEPRAPAPEPTKLGALAPSEADRLPAAEG